MKTKTENSGCKPTVRVRFFNVNRTNFF